MLKRVRGSSDLFSKCESLIEIMELWKSIYVKI